MKGEEAMEMELLPLVCCNYRVVVVRKKMNIKRLVMVPPNRLVRVKEEE